MKPWTVEDVMTRAVVAVPEQTPFKDIVQTLTTHRVSAVPVIDAERRVVGVVSEADLLHKLDSPPGETHRGFLDRKQRRTARTKASARDARDLMTAPAIVVSPSTPVAAAAQLMDREAVKRLPVVDDQGHLVGIVSRGDLLRIYLRDDATIREEVVNDILVGALWIDPSTVEVAVNEGVVQLAGTTDRRSTRDIVVELASTVAGVVSVVNDLSYEYDDTADVRRRGYLMRPSLHDVAPAPEAVRSGRFEAGDEQEWTLGGVVHHPLQCVVAGLLWQIRHDELRVVHSRLRDVGRTTQQSEQTDVTQIGFVSGFIIGPGKGTRPLADGDQDRPPIGHPHPSAGDRDGTRDPRPDLGPRRVVESARRAVAEDQKVGPRGLADETVGQAALEYVRRRPHVDAAEVGRLRHDRRQPPSRVGRVQRRRAVVLDDVNDADRLVSITALAQRPRQSHPSTGRPGVGDQNGCDRPAHRCPLRPRYRSEHRIVGVGHPRAESPCAAGPRASASRGIPADEGDCDTAV
jgi:CBS domain-containing protein